MWVVSITPGPHEPFSFRCHNTRSRSASHIEGCRMLRSDGRGMTRHPIACTRSRRYGHHADAMFAATRADSRRMESRCLAVRSASYVLCAFPNAYHSSHRHAESYAYQHPIARSARSYAASSAYDWQCARYKRNTSGSTRLSSITGIVVRPWHV